MHCLPQLRCRIFDLVKALQRLGENNLFCSWGGVAQILSSVVRTAEEFLTGVMPTGKALLRRCVKIWGTGVSKRDLIEAPDVRRRVISRVNSQCPSRYINLWEAIGGPEGLNWGGGSLILIKALGFKVGREAESNQIHRNPPSVEILEV